MSQFFTSIRLNSIKVSTVLLVAFMLYDIFMVFISPLIFKQSVMLEVATAGAGSNTQDTDTHTCERTPTERMPMLFLIPRFDWVCVFREGLAGERVKGLCEGA